MSQERELVASICMQTNQDIGVYEGFRLEPVRWETHTASDIGERSQEVINGQISSYDVYIGLMGTYFGSDTGKFQSGTEEEFEQAIKMNESGIANVVQFYFSNQKVAIEKIDVAQLERVKGFKKRVGISGVYYKSFEDLTQLEVQCRNGIFYAFRKVLTRRKEQDSSVPSPTSAVSLRPYETLKHLKKAFSEDPQVSSHILSVEATKNLAIFTRSIGETNSRVSKITKSLLAAAKDLGEVSSGKRTNATKAVKSLSRCMDSIEDFIYWFSREVEVMDRSFTVAMNSFQRAAQIITTSKEMDDEAVKSAIRQSFDLKARLDELKISVVNSAEGFLSALTHGDRLIGAGRAYHAIVLDFSDFLDRAMDTIDQIKDFVEHDVDA